MTSSPPSPLQTTTSNSNDKAITDNTCNNSWNNTSIYNNDRLIIKPIHAMVAAGCCIIVSAAIGSFVTTIVTLRRFRAPKRPTVSSSSSRHQRPQKQPQQPNENNSLKQQHQQLSPALQYSYDCRRLLPNNIILIRHGESNANVDDAVWKQLPDNLIGLSRKGKQQADDVGKRVRTVLDCFDNDTSSNNIATDKIVENDRMDITKSRTNPIVVENESTMQNNNNNTDTSTTSTKRIHLIVSPFERTKQTAAIVRRHVEPMIVRTDIESRIREQEVGNVQGDDFATYRQQQEQIGRFYYRFPTGESGADVFDRVKSWWYESILPVNLRIGYDPIDTIIVITHGLTIRFILMQLFNWSPTTFHSVYNAANCDMYILRKDLSKPGCSPYILDTEYGDIPKSSINLFVTKSDGTTITLRLYNYLFVPPPRTIQTNLIKHMLLNQYPNIFTNGISDIHDITFLPFNTTSCSIGMNDILDHKNNNIDKELLNHLIFNNNNERVTIPNDNDDVRIDHHHHHKKQLQEQEHCITENIILSNTQNEELCHYNDTNSLSSSGSSSSTSITGLESQQHSLSKQRECQQRQHQLEQSYRFPHFIVPSEELRNNNKKKDQNEKSDDWEETISKNNDGATTTK